MNREYKDFIIETIAELSQKNINEINENSLLKKELNISPGKIADTVAGRLAFKFPSWTPTSYSILDFALTVKGKRFFYQDVNAPMFQFSNEQEEYEFHQRKKEFEEERDKIKTVREIIEYLEKFEYLWEDYAYNKKKIERAKINEMVSKSAMNNFKRNFEGFKGYAGTQLAQSCAGSIVIFFVFIYLIIKGIF